MKLQNGIKNKLSEVVTAEKSASATGSGLVPVYSTPSLILLMEMTASQSVGPYLEPGYSTVGTMVQIKHLAATPIGMSVWCESVLTEVDGKRLVFSLEAYDEVGKIGEGVHERFIIDVDKFMSRAQAKLPKQ
jgi:predicted thioesterase